MNAFTLKSWSETPRTLPERLAWESVESGHAEGDPVDWNGATKEPFLSMEAQGAVKLQTVIRLTDTKVTVHFWLATDGSRSHLKVMSS
jgi:hypothetical protein